MLSRTVRSASSPDIRTATSRWMIGAFTLFLFAASALAQSTAGRILGTVSDQTGAAVGGATVLVTDVQRGTSRTLTTDDSGEYVAPELLPGSYKIRVEAKGFKASERPNIGVEVATDVRADFTLQPGQVSQVVVVEDAVPLVNTTSATLGGTLSNQEINDLPLSGRNYENLLQLRPGVIRYPGGGFSTTSANGLRAEDNGYYIEGLFDSEPYSGQSIVNGAGIAGDSATILPIDAIQEFNLQSNLPAEYGYKPGAVVNVGLKSGTNKVHGTAFGFGRDGALDGRNFFNAAPNPKLTRTLEQFGGSLGGALIKDKAFFFGAYEGQRYNVGNSFGGITSPSMVSMPTNGTCSFVATGDCADSIPDVIADLLSPANNSGFTVDAASLNIAGCTVSGGTVTCAGTGFPLNNAPSISITNGFNNVVHVDNVVGKVDYRLNDQHSISGTYFFGNNSGTVEDFPELQQKWLSDIHTRAQVVGGNWIWTPSSRWVNEVRAGYNRLYQPTLPGDLNAAASSYGGLNTGVSGANTGGLPRIGFGGYFFPGLGGFKWPKFQGPDSITQLIEQVTYSTGKHSMKFGGDLHYNKVTNAAYGNARGSITFLGGVASGAGAGSTPLEDFFAGLPFKSSVEVGNPTLHLHNWAYAGFFQDDWRTTKNLTINFGVRYEFSSVPQEANDLLGNFDPNVGMVQVGHGISSLYNPYHKSFGPRGGFAWDILGNGRTVLRGGGGLMYETVNWQSFVAFNNAFGPGSVPTGAPIDAAGDTSGGTITTGNATIKNFLNPVPWDTAGTPLYGGGSINCFLSPCPIMTVDRNLTTPYVWNWTLNVQHSFTQNVSMEFAYVGNRGTNLTGIRDINQPPVGSGWGSGPGGELTLCLQSAPAYDNCVVDNNNGEQTNQPFNSKFPYLANIFQMGNVYRSNYNALQVTLNARNYHGLSMVAGYTYAHALDDVGANWDFGFGSGLPQNASNPGAEYANSDFDMRHRLTISLSYAIPGRKGYGQMAEGWEINTITTLETPQYWGPMDENTDAAGIGPLPVSPPANTPIRWSFYGKTSDFKSQKGVGIPYFPGASNAACEAQAVAVDGGPVGASNASLNLFGCYANGNSVMLPPPLGQFGNMSRNMFQDTGFKNFDFSVGKSFHFGEAMRLQFRAEFFNIFNHPNFANPYGGQNGFGLNDPSVQPFGCGCATPDIAAANPAIGSGGPRSIQLGGKFIF
jgi:hypothetical protein